MLLLLLAGDFRRSHPGGRSNPKTRTRQPRHDQVKVCPLCKQDGRSNTNHFLSQCTFLPDNDRHFMVKARQIVGILDDEQDTNCDLDPDPPCPKTTLSTPVFPMQTHLDMANSYIYNVNNDQGTNKSYVDQHVAKAGDTMSGDLNMGGNKNTNIMLEMQNVDQMQ